MKRTGLLAGCLVSMSFLAACGSGGSGGSTDTDGGAQPDGGTKAGVDVAGAVPPAAIAAGCRAKQVSIDTAFPGIAAVRTSFGSSLGPDPKGGTIADGTYFLVDRTMRGSGSVPSSEKAALVFKANTLEFMKWHIAPQPDSSDDAWAGPVTTSGTVLDTSGMKTCWGSASLSSSIAYTATGTDIMMRFGIIDYTFRKQ
jgi:hypothetical protein